VSLCDRFVRTLQWATAVAIQHPISIAILNLLEISIPVFFLPKHCTLWVVEVMIAVGVSSLLLLLVFSSPRKNGVADFCASR
jgi:hypothetical protein